MAAVSVILPITYAVIPLGVALARSSVPSSRSTASSAVTPDASRRRRSSCPMHARQRERAEGERRAGHVVAAHQEQDDDCDTRAEEQCLQQVRPVGEGLPASRSRRAPGRAASTRAQPDGRRPTRSLALTSRTPAPAPCTCPPGSAAAPRGPPPPRRAARTARRVNSVASSVGCTYRCPSTVHRTSACADSRSASSSGDPSAMIAPPARIITRSASFSASARSWVVSSTVACSRSVSRCTSSWNSRRAIGSKPAVGSSRKSSSGRPTMPIATSSRRRCPPDRYPIRRSACAVRPDEVDQLGGVPRPGNLRPSRTARSRRRGGAAARGPATWRGPARTGARPRAAPATARPPCAGSAPSTLTCPGRPRPEPFEDLDRGGLARAVRPEDRDDFPGAYAEADAVQDLRGPVPHPQVANFGCNIRHDVQKIADLLQKIRALLY